MQNELKYIYFDVETTGYNPKESKLTLISFARLNILDGEIIHQDELRQMKEWKLGEKEMIRKFLCSTCLPSRNFNGKWVDKWFDMPIGFNLFFDFNFIKKRAEKYNIKNDYTYEGLAKNTPMIDLHSVALMMNKGVFLGSGLDKMTGKIGDGKHAIEFYNNKEYQKLLDYNEQEFKEFIKWFKFLIKRLSELKEEYTSTLTIKVIK